MIVVEAGKRDARSFDAKILFAAQLADLGHQVVIDENTQPENIDRSQKYELAPFLADISKVEISGVVVIGAETLDDETLMTLRSYNLAEDVAISAIGRFEDHQSLVGTFSKIAYAVGKEPNVIDLGEMHKNALLESSITPLVASDMRCSGGDKPVPELFIYLPSEWLDEPLNLPMLAAMDHLAGFHLNVVIEGNGKEQIRRSKYASLSVFGLAELSPSTLAKIANIAVFFGDGVPGERMASFAMSLMCSHGVVIDSTLSGAFVASGAPVVRGPLDMAALANYLQNSVLNNLTALGKEAAESEWIRCHSIRLLEAELGLPSAGKAPENNLPSRTIFLPTNGNGLGHAQRSSLIAMEMKSRGDVAFAAFPSCVNLINDKGFPCIPLVQKSDSHVEEYANDLVNYLRLKRTVRTGDKLVFDGGYVFDSIYRTIVENGLSATWIRRGLWQAGQVNSAAFSREKVFENVIVPNEAFDELNSAYTFGRNVHQVGPVVQKPAAAMQSDALRAKLAAEFQCEFDTLVVTMLGGGYAVDRSAQMQTLAALMERRANCLHLVVVWPGAKVSPGLSGWKNTRVVRTRNALALSQAANLVVSAAGYNSYHEILYHGIPSILIPQTAPFMDDQEKRANAASDRGLAVTVLGQELLLLEREVAAFLEGGKAADIRAALKDFEFPATGNIAAARIIEGDVSDA
ncbi:MAG: glycosyltransferase [Paracoccaceae bacterium]